MHESSAALANTAAEHTKNPRNLVLGPTLERTSSAQGGKGTCIFSGRSDKVAGAWATKDDEPAVLAVKLIFIDQKGDESIAIVLCASD